jgi:hypothetical protein
VAAEEGEAAGEALQEAEGARSGRSRGRRGPNSPVPDCTSQSRPRWRRGECGITLNILLSFA